MRLPISPRLNSPPIIPPDLTRFTILVTEPSNTFNAPATRAPLIKSLTIGIWLSKTFNISTRAVKASTTTLAASLVPRAITKLSQELCNEFNLPVKDSA